MKMTEFGRRVSPLRGCLVVLFVLMGLRFWVPNPQLSSALGWLLLITGLAMRCWGVGGWYPRRLLTYAPEHLITRDGPYAYTRNPCYLGDLLLGWGICQIAGLQMGLQLYAPFWAALYGPVIAHEEQMLSQRYGSDYADYCRRVPRFFGLGGPALLPQLLPLRWDSALCLEAYSAAGWISLGCFVQCWRWVHLGYSPCLYRYAFLVSAAVWVGLRALVGRLGPRVCTPVSIECCVTVP